VRRPSRPTAQAGGRGEPTKYRRFVGAPCITPATPAGGRAEARHEVSEPHRVGAKPPLRAIAAGGCLSRSARARIGNQRPLTRETSAPRSSSCSGQTGMREGTTADWPLERRRRGESRVGASGRSGVDRPMVVLADRLVGRSRRTTRGLERTGAMSSGERQGLAPSPSRGEGAKERRKPGPGGKTSTRWRARVRDSVRKRRVERAFVDGRRLGANDAVPLTRHRASALQSAGVRFGARSSTAGRQRKTTLSARGRKRREPEGAARGDLDRVPTRIGQRPRSRLHDRASGTGPAERRVRTSEARGAPSSAP
jgi:hypothetical protein